MAIVVDLWRWGVFSGEIKPERYNESWWNLQRNYQGLAPPIARDENDFDAGMFYHISNNAYVIYDFFQFLMALFFLTFFTFSINTINT